MTFSKLTWLKRLRGVKMPNARFRVLLAVFNYTGKDGTSAHPGTALLAADTGIDRRDVRRHLRALEHDRWLIVQHPGGNQHFKGAAATYRLGNGPTPREDVERTESVKGGDSRSKGGDSLQARGGTIPLPSDQLSDHSIIPLENSRDRSADQSRVPLENSRDRSADQSKSTASLEPIPPPGGYDSLSEGSLLEEWLLDNGLDLSNPSLQRMLDGMASNGAHPKAIFFALRKAGA